MLIEKNICPNANIIKLLLTNTKCGITTEVFRQALENQCGTYTIFSNAQSQMLWSCYNTKGFKPATERSLTAQWSLSAFSALYVQSLLWKHIWFNRIPFTREESKFDMPILCSHHPGGNGSHTPSMAGKIQGSWFGAGCSETEGTHQRTGSSLQTNRRRGGTKGGPTPSNMVVVSTLPCKKL